MCVLCIDFNAVHNIDSLDQVKMMVYRDETSLKDDDMLDIIEVELLKKPGRGLGLSIVGRRNGPGVYISDVVREKISFRFLKHTNPLIELNFFLFIFLSRLCAGERWRCRG